MVFLAMEQRMKGIAVWPLVIAAALVLVWGGMTLWAQVHRQLQLQLQPITSSPQQQQQHVVDTILDCYSSSGKWVFDATPRHLPWNVAGDVTANQCDERHVSRKGNVAGQQASMSFTAENWTVRNELKWVWRTSNESCPWVPFNRDQMCRLVGKRNVLLVGDSINHELQWTFVNHLSKSKVVGSLELPSRGMVAACRRCISEALCDDVLGGEGFKVGFIRNDRLSLRLDVMEDLHSDIIEWAWVPYLEIWHVEILILNRGAHYEDDQHYMEALSNLFMLLHKSFPNLLVIYRNTPTGHLDCASHKGPLHQPLKVVNDVWNWANFPLQNQLAKNIVHANGLIYLDVDTMLSLRPDGHLDAHDCLHYCIPGPLDVVVELFFNLMRILQSN